MIKTSIRKLITSCDWGRAIFALRAERHMARYFSSIGLVQLNQQIYDDMAGRVSGGPFAGMRYLRTASGSVLAPKLLGTYEMELHSVVREISEHNPSMIVDLGAAEGYYAVGFARLCERTIVAAFDGNPLARIRCGKLARLNAVTSRVICRGFASAPILGDTLCDHSAVVWCDIEGGEHKILDPLKVPNLKRALIVFETHSHLSREPYTVIIERFRETHSVQVIHQESRHTNRFPCLAHVNAMSLNEFRHQAQSWVVLRPHLSN